MTGVRRAFIVLIGRLTQRRHKAIRRKRVCVRVNTVSYVAASFVFFIEVQRRGDYNGYGYGVCAGVYSVNAF
jgi:hypothetical protein